MRARLEPRFDAAAFVAASCAPRAVAFSLLWPARAVPPRAAESGDARATLARRESAPARAQRLLHRVQAALSA